MRTDPRLKKATQEVAGEMIRTAGKLDLKAVRAKVEEKLGHERQEIANIELGNRIESYARSMIQTSNRRQDLSQSTFLSKPYMVSVSDSELCDILDVDVSYIEKMINKKEKTGETLRVSAEQARDAFGKWLEEGKKTGQTMREVMNAS
ncbi:MAG: hypothetical protein N4A65_00300 [Cohaesibacter sp.]|jgi:hypothetical protein|nr:hypothetical protein [Cohaesibacter sp.]